MQTSSRAKSFTEVLEAEIRVDLRREMEADLFARQQAAAPSAALHAAGRLETWLASHVGPITFAAHGAARKKYGTTQTKAGIGETAGAASLRGATANRPASNDATLRAFAAGESTLASSGAAGYVTAVSAEELMSLELLKRHSSVNLAASFREDDLKRAWRKAALKSHPDRFASADLITQMRMTVLFRELAEAYSCLSQLLDRKAA